MDHDLPILRLLQPAPQPCNDASELIIICGGGGEIKDLQLLRANFFFLYSTALSLPPAKLSLYPLKSCDKLISESVDVKDEDSGRMLEGLLLLWMITSQSLNLVTFLFSRISWQ